MITVAIQLLGIVKLFWGKFRAVEMMNLGPMEFLLFPKMYICQLIVEEVSGCPADAPNQFKGQKSPAGQVAPKSAETRASEK